MLRLTQGLWRMKRRDRIQESVARRQVESGIEKGRMRAVEPLELCENALACMQSLRAVVVHADYCTGPGEIKSFENTHKSAPEGVALEIYVLLQRLRKPGLELEDELPAAQGQEREDFHRGLQDLLAKQVRELEQACSYLEEEFRNVSSPDRLDALLAPVRSHVALMMRMEDSSLRQVCG